MSWHSTAFGHVSSRFSPPSTVPHSPKRVILASLPIIALAFLPKVYSNYQAYLSLGYSKVPHNVLGWLFSTSLKPLGKETKDTKVYEMDADESVWIEGELPERKGERATTGWHFAPHRQTNQFPDQKAREAMKTAFHDYALAHTDIIEVATSINEGNVPALMVHHSIPSPNPVVDREAREIAHIHEHADGSIHLALAPLDCKAVIERGWGERHPLSGVLNRPRPRTPSSQYLMIYAPRDEEEVQVVMQIIRAATGYMTGKRVEAEAESISSSWKEV